MGKYEPLTHFLSQQRAERLPMTFEEIETIVGSPLPRSSRTHRAWWSNNPSNNVMTRAWLAAGYETADVDLASEKLLFRRKTGPEAPSPAPTVSRPPASPMAGDRPRSHPALGAMKGMMTVHPGTDLTAPASDEWDDADAA